MEPRALPLVVLTDRSRLRALRNEDGEALRALWRANRERFADSFYTTVSQLADAERSDQYLQAKAADWAARTGFWYGIWQHSGLGLLGQIQIKRVDWEVGCAEVAYLLDREFEGRGLVTDAVRRLATASFEVLGLHKLYLRTIAGNQRSEAVAARCGFSLEGTLRGEFMAAGARRVDVRYFGRLATDPTAT